MTEERNFTSCALSRSSDGSMMRPIGWLWRDGDSMISVTSTLDGLRREDRYSERVVMISSRSVSTASR